MKQKYTVAELKYFNDHLKKVFNIFRAENKKIQLEQESEKYFIESFEVIKEIFDEIGELAIDLNSEELGKYFISFSEAVIQINKRTKKNNDSTKFQERTLKKLALMVHDYENLLGHLIQCYDEPNKIDGVMRAFEVQSFNLSRLKRSLTEETARPSKDLRKF